MDAPVYKKLVDIEEHLENPFFTKEGQLVVSESENFWQRALRYGRSAYGCSFGSNLTANITNNTYSYSVDSGCVFIPDVISASADVDSVIYIGYTPMDNYDPYNTTQANEYIFTGFVKAGTPVVIELNGSVQLAHPNGTIYFRHVPIANGKGYCSVHGVEVTKHA